MRQLFKIILYIFLYKSIIYSGNSYSQKRFTDTAYFKKILHENIRVIVDDSLNGTWILDNENQNKIYHVNKKGKIKDIVASAKLPFNTTYSDILVINRKNFLLGTTNDYVYCVHSNKYTRLDNVYGLTDSTIKAIEKDITGQHIIIRARNSTYAIFNINSKSIGIQKIPDNNENGKELNSFQKYLHFPVQKAFCKAVSDIDYSFRKEKLINKNALKHIKSVLKPGDIIVKRNDYQVTNWGIPGFWTHSGIYIGGINELDLYFDTLPMLRGIKPSEYIKINFPKVYEVIYNKNNLIIEAIGEGVVINPVEHIAKVDYFAAFRSSLPMEDLFKSVLEALSKYMMPYDFLFDFETDDSFVCSELIYKSFSPFDSKKGIVFKPGLINDKLFLSPNDIAKQYAEEYNLPKPQLKLVIFYDSDSKLKKSFLSNSVAFVKTWER